MEAYAHIQVPKLDRIQERLQVGLNQSEIDNCITQWSFLSDEWIELHDRLEQRSKFLKATEDWLCLLMQLTELYRQFSLRFEELGKRKPDQFEMITYTLERFENDLDKLRQWQSTVEVACLQQADHQSSMSSTPGGMFIDSISTCLQQTNTLHETIVDELNKVKQWNLKKTQAHLLVNEIDCEIERVKVRVRFNSNS